jgi:multisubunit Na+/H+ antiporter MnhC subunit
VIARGVRLEYVGVIVPILFVGSIVLAVAGYAEAAKWTAAPLLAAFVVAAVVAGVGMAGLILYGAWEYLLRPIVRALVRDALRDDLPRE